MIESLMPVANPNIPARSYLQPSFRFCICSKPTTTIKENFFNAS